MSGSRIIMGIDPGTHTTGYGLIAVQGKHMQLLTYGAIHLGKQTGAHTTKLKKIYDRVQSLIREFHPKEMAIEAPFYGKNIQSMLKLGRAQGIAIAAGLVEEIEIFEYAPRKVKSAVTGNGSASKSQVAAMLEHLLHVTLEDIAWDATDGLAVAVCHYFQSAKAITQGGKSIKDWNSYLQQNPERIKKRKPPKDER